MVDRNDRYYLTTAEMLVMRVIWTADHDLVLNEVLNQCNDGYGKDWKPQTVSTYLSHLVQKQFLRMNRNGKIYSYHPIVDRLDFMQYDIANFLSYWEMSADELLSWYLKLRETTPEEREEMRKYIDANVND